MGLALKEKEGLKVTLDFPAGKRMHFVGDVPEQLRVALSGEQCGDKHLLKGSLVLRVHLQTGQGKAGAPA